MKQLKHVYLLAAFALAFSLGSGTAWCSRVFTDKVSGEITAVPLSGSIEIDHHPYHIKAGSSADSLLHTLNQGQKVEVLLDGPASSKTSEVVLITVAGANSSREST